LSAPKLRNLGKVSAGWLADLGIHTLDNLEEAGGPVPVYVRLKSLGYNASLNLLWALQGAVLDLPWNEIPPEMKERLKEEVAAAEEDLKLHPEPPPE
jgi:DNA transformation protein and related proteins